MTEHFMERMTWKEVDARLKAGVDAVILPIGTPEQHGPHMPLDTDCVIARSLAERAAAAAEADGLSVLIAPTLNVTLSWYHMQFPGSMRLSTPTFLLDLLESLLLHRTELGRMRRSQLRALAAQPVQIVLQPRLHRSRSRACRFETDPQVLPIRVSLVVRSLQRPDELLLRLQGAPMLLPVRHRIEPEQLRFLPQLLCLAPSFVCLCASRTSRARNGKKLRLMRSCCQYVPLLR